MNVIMKTDGCCKARYNCKYLKLLKISDLHHPEWNGWFSSKLTKISFYFRYSNAKGPPERSTCQEERKSIHFKEYPEGNLRDLIDSRPTPRWRLINQLNRLRSNWLGWTPVSPTDSPVSEETRYSGVSRTTLTNCWPWMHHCFVHYSLPLF